MQEVTILKPGTSEKSGLIYFKSMIKEIYNTIDQFSKPGHIAYVYETDFESAPDLFIKPEHFKVVGRVDSIALTQDYELIAQLDMMRDYNDYHIMFAGTEEHDVVLFTAETEQFPVYFYVYDNEIS